MSSYKKESKKLTYHLRRLHRLKLISFSTPPPKLSLIPSIRKLFKISSRKSSQTLLDTINLLSGFGIFHLNLCVDICQRHTKFCFTCTTCLGGILSRSLMDFISWRFLFSSFISTSSRADWRPSGCAQSVINGMQQTVNVLNSLSWCLWFGVWNLKFILSVQKCRVYYY